MKNQLIRSSIASATTMAIGACALATCAMAATTVPVPNSSFETPNVTGIAPYSAQHAASGTPIIGTWVRYGGFAAVVEGGRYGVSPTGLDGTQFGDQTASGGSGVFQDIAPYDGSGSAAQYWQAGMIYSFTVGVFTRSDNSVVAPDRMDLKLYSRDTINGAPEVHGFLSVLGSNVTPGSLTDFSFNVTTQASDAFIGRPIGVWFDSVSGGTGDWGYDNVRLSSTAVPETSSLMSAALGVLVLFRRRR